MMCGWYFSSFMVVWIKSNCRKNYKKALHTAKKTYWRAVEEQLLFATAGDEIYRYVTSADTLASLSFHLFIYLNPTASQQQGSVRDTDTTIVSAPISTAVKNVHHVEIFIEFSFSELFKWATLFRLACWMRRFIKSVVRTCTVSERRDIDGCISREMRDGQKTRWK